MVCVVMYVNCASGQSAQKLGQKHAEKTPFYTSQSAQTHAVREFESAPAPIWLWVYSSDDIMKQKSTTSHTEVTSGLLSPSPPENHQGHAGQEGER